MPKTPACIELLCAEDPAKTQRTAMILANGRGRKRASETAASRAAWLMIRATARIELLRV